MFQLKVSTCTIKKKADFFVTTVFIYLLLFLNPFTAKDILIEFTLMPDDFTRQRETPWQ